MIGIVFLLIFLKFFGFLVKVYQQVITLLWCTFHERFTVFLFGNLIQFLHALKEGVLIFFLITVIYNYRHELTNFRIFSTWRGSSWQNGFSHFIKIGNIFGCKLEAGAILRFGFTTLQESLCSNNSAA